MNIVVVDDHPIVCDAIRSACEPNSGWRVVGETGSGAVAIEMVQRLRPEAIVLDLGLDDLNGLIVAEHVRLALPALRILVLSGWLNEYVVLRLARLGVQGFITKRDARPDLLREALRAVASGRTYFSKDFRAFKRDRCPDTLGAAILLSPREQQVLALIGVFKDDEEIADLLDLAPSTVQTHRSHILRSLNLSNTPQLIAYAQESGFALAAADIICEIAAEEIAAGWRQKGPNLNAAPI
jgi:DNA-binding NarL/FixJ family response regulator